jgi:hypothetical protein
MNFWINGDAPNPRQAATNISARSKRKLMVRLGTYGLLAFFLLLTVFWVALLIWLAGGLFSSRPVHSGVGKSEAARVYQAGSASMLDLCRWQVSGSAGLLQTAVSV